MFKSNDVLDLRCLVLQRIERYRRSLVRASGAEQQALQGKLNEAEDELRCLSASRMASAAHWAMGSPSYQTA